MTQTADALGFTYSCKGCVCERSPLIYKKEVGGTVYRLKVWLRHDVWKLYNRGCMLASGNKDNMTDKIKAIWDL